MNNIWRFQAYKEAVQARLSIDLSKYHIVGNTCRASFKDIVSSHIHCLKKCSLQHL